MRIDPPPSLPVASEHSPAATAAPAPPEEPPVVRSVFHGLRQWSPSRFCVCPSRPNSGVFVLPRITAPAALTRSTTAESSSGTLSWKASDPPVVRIPRVSSRSLIEMGTPCSGPRASPRATAASASLAESMAWSAVTVKYELSRESSRSMRSRYSSVTSTGETSPDAISALSSVVDVKARSSLLLMLNPAVRGYPAERGLSLRSADYTPGR